MTRGGEVNKEGGGERRRVGEEEGRGGDRRRVQAGGEGRYQALPVAQT